MKTDEPKYVNVSHQVFEVRTTRREIGPRCRHSDCLDLCLAELVGEGLTDLASEIRKSDLPVRCRRARSGT